MKSVPWFLTDFPGGVSGIGLLLIRVVLGVNVLVQATPQLSGAHALPATAWTIVLISGAFLVVGLRTRLFALISGVGLAVIFVRAAGVSVSDPLGKFLPWVLEETLSIGMFLLGPGAFSVDARLFGRKEIVLSRRSRD